MRPDLCVVNCHSFLFKYIRQTITEHIHTHKHRQAKSQNTHKYINYLLLCLRGLSLKCSVDLRRHCIVQSNAACLTTLPSYWPLERRHSSFPVRPAPPLSDRYVGEERLSSSTALGHARPPSRPSAVLCGMSRAYRRQVYTPGDVRRRW